MGPTPRAIVRALLKADLPKRLTDAASIQAAEFFQDVDFVRSSAIYIYVHPPSISLCASSFDDYAST